MRHRRKRRKPQPVIEGAERGADFYDDAFAESEELKVHYTKSVYYPSWTLLFDRLRGAEQPILDIGCGPGQFAMLLRDQGVKRYAGLDFSATQIVHARELCPEYDFHCDDVFATTLLDDFDYKTVVSTEFLEHIERDLEVIGRIREGTYFVGSVPNFPSAGHVRHFKTIEEVAGRYGQFFDGFRVTPILLKDNGATLYLFDGHRNAVRPN